jgi:hypothetical protein
MISKRFPHRLSASPSPSIFFFIIISFNHSPLHHVLMTLAAEKQHGPTGLLIMRYVASTCEIPFGVEAVARFCNWIDLDDFHKINFLENLLTEV